MSFSDWASIIIVSFIILITLAVASFVPAVNTIIVQML